MTTKIVLATVSMLALTLASVAWADDNFSNVEQNGSDNDGLVTQGPGEHNRFGKPGDAALQKGSGNRLEILQEGSRNEVGTEGRGFEQYGEANRAKITQRSDRNFVGEIIQNGKGGGLAEPRNSLTIVQGDASGDGRNTIWRVKQVKRGDGGADAGNATTIRQAGGRNEIGLATGEGVLQRGRGNTMEAAQRSDHNSIGDVLQRGQDNYVRIVQSQGNRNSIGTVRQRGSDNTLTLRQRGARNDISLVRQNGRGNDATLAFDGDGNGTGGFSGLLTGIAGMAATVGQGTVTQLLGANTLGYRVEGNHNHFGFWQEGDGNRTDGFAEGNGNEIVLYQNGNRNGADFSQQGSGNQTALGQDGRNNYAGAFVTGSYNLTGIGQFGNSNDASIDIDGNRNIILVGQAGNRNDADAAINGNRNFALIGQIHDGRRLNSISLSVTGKDNNNPGLASYAFTGAALAAAGPLVPGMILQAGHANSLSMTVGANNISDRNMFAFSQTGAGNTIRGAIDGNSNQVAIVQAGNGNLAAFIQLGSNNVIGVTQ
jgi:catechol 2,3-dioxygenase-like lactoylglutathione lyase family enzyme